MAITLPFAGHIYNTDGDLVENAVVYIYNKDLDESKNANDTNFQELKTNSSGEYQCNLANFDGEWTTGDVIWYSAFYEDRAQSGSIVLTGSPVSDRDLTLRNLEPGIAIQKLLMAKLVDPNLSGRETNEKWIRPRYSKRELTKENYPIISINDIDEDSETAGIYSNKSEERTHIIEIKIHIWAKTGESQKFTIGGVKYEGTKLRDYLGRKVSDVLRKEFYQKPNYNKDAIVHKFYDYTKIRMESTDYDEESDFGIMDKEIEIEIKTINQEV